MLRTSKYLRKEAYKLIEGETQAFGTLKSFEFQHASKNRTRPAVEILQQSAFRGIFKKVKNTRKYFLELPLFNETYRDYFSQLHEGLSEYLKIPVQKKSSNSSVLPEIGTALTSVPCDVTLFITSQCRHTPDIMLTRNIWQIQNGSIWKFNISPTLFMITHTRRKTSLHILSGNVRNHFMVYEREKISPHGRGNHRYKWVSVKSYIYTNCEMWRETPTQ